MSRPHGRRPQHPVDMTEAPLDHTEDESEDESQPEPIPDQQTSSQLSNLDRWRHEASKTPEVEADPDEPQIRRGQE